MWKKKNRYIIEADVELMYYASVCILSICDPARKNYLGAQIYTGKTEEM